ncbi:MAG: hypothetical protein ACLQAH_12845 [Limisphaerales bacterium]
MSRFPAILSRWFAGLVFIPLFLPAALAGGYTNLSVAVYFRYQEVHSIPDNLDRFSNQWVKVEKQLKVDKVYLETTRNGQVATEADVTTMKKFFADRGIKTSAGMGLTVNEPNGYQSYNYSTPADREKVKSIAEFTARHFDEIILDDFFFTNDKSDDSIAAKGDRSWTAFRTELMDEVSRNLILGPARTVNPRVRVIIKFPNWYESFPGLGYDLAVEPKLFDAIYTGTETRNANFNQRLQSYQSYLQTEYFNHIKPGGNQGGWIDGGRDVERYAEMFWDTFFARVPEIVLFNSLQITGELNIGNRGGEVDTNASLARLIAPIPQPDGSAYTPDMVARIAGYSAELLDPFLGKLGRPVGVATYKPCNSVGEAYLPDFLGMIGVPIDLVPEFPTNATTILLTAASVHDKDLVAKVKKFVQAGGRVIATTGLMEALGDKGFQDIAEIEVTGHRVLAKHFGGGQGGFGGGGRNADTMATNIEPDLNILIPQLRHFENDTWTGLPFSTAAYAYPMAVSASYGRGMFYALAIPDDFADLYRMPRATLNQIRGLLGHDLFVSLDSPDHVSLFAYDNRTFIVQNFRSQPVTVRVLVVHATSLRDLLSGEKIAAVPDGADNADSGRPRFGGGRGNFGGAGGTPFEVVVSGHSFRVFQAK